MKKETETISICFEKIEDCYSKFSIPHNKVFDKNAVEFIEDSLKDTKSKSNIKLEIHLKKDCEEKDKLECEKTIKKYYKNNYTEKSQENMKLTIISLSCLLIGIIFITLLNFLSKLSTPYVILLILEIVSWVFVWEFVDVFVFSRFLNRIKMNNIKKMKNCSIIFIID